MPPPVPHSIPTRMLDRRAQVADRYLVGTGIEIGAAHYPVRLPSRVTCRYVDHCTVAELEKIDADTAKFHTFIQPDLISKAETLDGIEDGSLDWAIACHVLEHLANPLGAVRCHMRKVKPGGIVMYAIPDMRRCFDRRRVPTPFDCLLVDEHDDSVETRVGHYLIWARDVLGLTGDVADRTAREMCAEKANIHFHAWDDLAWCETMLGLATEAQCWLEGYERNDTEFITILRRPPSGPA